MVVVKSIIAQQAREFMLGIDKEFSIEDVVYVIQQGYPSNAKTKQAIMEICCTQLAKLVNENIIEPVDISNLQSGKYRPLGS